MSRAMQCTPKSNVNLQSYKGQHCYEDCSDSGYSGWFQSPQSISGGDISGSLSPSEICETPKENLRLHVTPKEQSRGPVRVLGRDREAALVGSWCETPKLNRRGPLLRHKLLTSKPALVKTDGTGPTFPSNAESCLSKRPEHWLSASFNSLDLTTDGATGGSNMGHDAAMSGRKRRDLFSQMRTSTREDGKPDTCMFSFEGGVVSEADFGGSISLNLLDAETPRRDKLFPALTNENLQSPLNSESDDSGSLIYTPLFTQTPKDVRSVCEDSGFSSLTLDKSQDSLVDHNGSFQELLGSASKGINGTPNLNAKRLSRLQRHHRLSTLKEGGSQSEEDSGNRRHEERPKNSSHSNDDVFAEVTPCSKMSDRCFKGLIYAKNDSNTPLSASSSKLEKASPQCADPAPPAMTPLRMSPADLSLTPALQLVHAICQQRVQRSGQSPSLREELKLTAALVETPVMFRTTMPLAGMIGRKMGLGELDILTELKKRNLRHILANIFSKLNPECLYRCGLVCKSWNEMIHQDHQASLRRMIYMRELEEALEHSVSVFHISEGETRSTLLKRSALKRIQARSRTNSCSTQQSANSTLSTGGSSKHERFLEVAKTLFSDECIKPCPRCQHPARCHSVKGEGVCSRGDCRFQFCMSCLCAFHGSRECGSRSAGRRKKDTLLPGSAESKRNVRRL